MFRRATTVAAFAACGVASSAAVELPRSLLLITIDTLRADYLSCNGSSRVKTPNLDRLAREGVSFTRARSPVPLTLPAHASILTGNYPPTHSVRDNGAYRLPEAEISLAEVLRDRGYSTAAFVSSFVLDRRFGLSQGFEVYDDRVWKELAEQENLEAERSAEEVFAAFEEWLARGRGEEPFFVWIHLYDPHAPYLPPEPFRSRYPEDLYAGEVAYADDVVGRILSELDASDRLYQTLVAVVGDHGEGLGEHREATHSLLIYNSTLHVPMLLRAPGLLAGGQRVDLLVRVIDLSASLLELLGIEGGLGEGVSLFRRPPEGGDTSIVVPHVTAYSESLYAELNLGWSALRGLESGDFRLILAPGPELFDLRRDPGETVNRLDDESVVYQRLKRELMERMRSFGEEVGTQAPRPLDPESEARLRSLGYLSGGRAPPDRRARRVNPMERIDLWNRIQRGIAEFSLSDFHSAAATFEAVIAEDPDIPLVYEYLGSCWQELSALDKAEKVYRQALERGFDSASVHHELGRLHRQRGELPHAARELQTAVALDAKDVAAQHDLAAVYRVMGQLARAETHYLAAVELNPDYLWAWNGLGMTLATLGRREDALDAFQRVIEIDPRGSFGYFNLAVHLESMQRDEQALEAYRRFLELSADGDLREQRLQAQSAIERLRN